MPGMTVNRNKLPKSNKMKYQAIETYQQMTQGLVLSERNYKVIVIDTFQKTDEKMENFSTESIF